MNNQLLVMPSVGFLQYQYIFLMIEFVSIDLDYFEDNCKTLYSWNDDSFEFL